MEDNEDVEEIHVSRDILFMIIIVKRLSPQDYPCHDYSLYYITINSMGGFIALPIFKKT